MKFDLKDFKKVQENNKGITLEHKKGHKISIAKTGISDNLKSQFASMPLHQADPKEEVQSQDPGFLDQASDYVKNIFANTSEPEQAQEPIQNYMNPDIKAKRDIYNQKEQAKQMVFGTNPMFGFGKGNSTFGPNGEQPENLDVPAWQAVNSTYEAEKAADQARKQVAAKDANQAAIEENVARQQAGLPPIAIPPAPAQQQNAGPDYQKANFGNQGFGQAQTSSEAITPASKSDFEKYMNQYQQGYQKQLGGIEQQEKAEGEQGSALQQAAQDQISQINELNKHQQDAFNDLNKERQSLMHDIQNGQINPQHYVENMSTPGKVSTAIGILLSGAGSGLGGGENMAMKFLNEQIDRDINSQRINLASKENLLSANLRQFGNMHDAMAMTRVMQNDIYSTKIQQEAAKAQGPLAQAKAQQMIGGLQQQNAQIMQGMSLKLGAMNMLQGGMNKSGEIAPEQKIRALSLSGIIPEGEKEKLTKSLQTMQNDENALANLRDTFDQVKNINVPSNRVFSPLQSKRQLDALIEPTLGKLTKDTEGRVTPTDIATLRPLFKELGDSPETVALKEQKMNEFIQSKMNYPDLAQYGIHSKFSKYQPMSHFNVGAPVKKKEAITNY